jgi:hypothetical protein
MNGFIFDVGGLQSNDLIIAAYRRRGRYLVLPSSGPISTIHSLPLAMLSYLAASSCSFLGPPISGLPQTTLTHSPHVHHPGLGAGPPKDRR